MINKTYSCDMCLMPYPLEANQLVGIGFQDDSNFNLCFAGPAAKHLCAQCIKQIVDQVYAHDDYIRMRADE